MKRSVSVVLLAMLSFAWAIKASAGTEACDVSLCGGKGHDPATAVSKTIASRSAAAVELLSVSRPPIVTRTQWGCTDGQSSPGWTPQYTVVSHLIVHHSATPNGEADWPARVRNIFHDHRNIRDGGWGDIGYNYLIDPNGVIYEGRAHGDNVIGAHFSCVNGGTMGVCLLGNFESSQPTQAALASLMQLLAWKCDQRGINPLGSAYHSNSQLTLPNISGHRDSNSTSAPRSCPKGTVCPGAQLYALLPNIRNGVDALIDSGGSTTTTRSTTSTTRSTTSTTRSTTTTTIGSTLPDLTILEPVTFTPASAAQGATITVNWTEKNNGSTASSPAHNTKLYLSSSAYGTTHQIAYFGPMSVLAGGTTAPYNSGVHAIVPASIPPGNYYVTAFIDCDQYVSEANEGNNIGSSSPNRITITGSTTSSTTTRSTTSTTRTTTSTTRSTTSTTRSTTTTTISGAAFSGAFDGGGGRKYLAWFGWYNDQNWPWIWDYQFGGWIWVVDNGPQNLWLWQENRQRWMWTRTDWYRWVWYPGDAGLTWRAF